MTDTFVFHTVAGLQYSLPQIQLATADNIDMDDCSGMSSRGWHHLAPLGAINSGTLNLPIRPYPDCLLPFDLDWNTARACLWILGRRSNKNFF